LPDTPLIAFVATPRGNYYMTELLAALRDAVREAGYAATLELDGFPAADPGAAVYVVIPHEYRACEPTSAWPSADQRRRTIALCVENPYTQWFDAVCALSPQFARVLTINRASVTAMAGRGITADHLQLGYTASWDHWHAAPGPRPIDVTYLGAEDPRRDALLAGYGRWWWHRRTSILVPVLAPKRHQRPDYLVDDAKYEHLRRCKVLVNLHREGSRSFEWVRVLEAIANGCVVVSEPAHDCAPLVPGEHFVVADAESIPHVVEGLLSQPERLAELQMSAYETVRQELSMATAARMLIETAESLARSDVRALADPDPAPDPSQPESVAPEPVSAEARMRAGVRKLATETLELRREVQRLHERFQGRDPDAEPEPVAVTPAFEEARPRVSVAITVHNYEREVVEALASVDRSEFEDYEVLVVDDASSDGSLRSVRDFLLAHPWMPATVLSNRVNRGPAASRNALARQARGELMFVLDADNSIYPPALGRLVHALDRDPGAAFAYPLIAQTRSGAPVGLLSRYAWDPSLLRGGNYVDVMAMYRLDDFFALGGFTEDVRVTGWEDFFFWCACAESGRRGHLISEVLANYRQTGHSVLGWTQTDTTVAWSVLHARFPEIIPWTPGG